MPYMVGIVYSCVTTVVLYQKYACVLSSMTHVLSNQMSITVCTSTAVVCHKQGKFIKLL